MKNAIRAGISRQFRYVAFALIGLALAACETVPIEQFNAYRQSVTAARDASQIMLVTFEADAQYLQDQISASSAGATTSSTGYTAANPVGSSQDRDLTLQQHIMVRTSLWEALTAYNEALAFLAEGRSVEQIKTSYSGFSGAVSGLISAVGSSHPLVAPISNLIGGFVELAETARSREEFRKIATDKGHALVLAVITALREDAKSVDQVSRTAALGYIDNLGDEAIFGPIAEIESLVDSVSDADRTSLQIQASLTRAIGYIEDFESMAQELRVTEGDGSGDGDGADHFAAPTSTTGALDSVLPSQVTQFVNDLGELHAEAESAFENYNKSNAALTEYYLLLDAIESAANSLANPEIYQLDPVASASEIATGALMLRRLVEAVDSARN